MRLLPAAVALLLVAPLSSLEAQRRYGPSPLDTLGKDPDQAVGREILRKVRSMRVTGDYWFRIELRQLPRRGEAYAYAGQMLGTPGGEGPVTRIDLDLGGGADGRCSLRLLLRNGPNPEAWRFDPSKDDAPHRLQGAALFEPLADTEFSAFELLAPFIYWSRYYYEGRGDRRGRPTHHFFMYPPKDDNPLNQRVSGVRLYVDDQFDALIEVEIFGPDETPQKTLSILDFRKEGGQWIVGRIDCLDERTRDKTRLSVLDANMEANHPEGAFEPAALERSLFRRLPDAPD